MKKQKTICLTIVSIILIFSFGVMSSQATPAPVAAVDINQIINYTINSFSLGWQFNVVNTPITVTALGFFDLGSVPGYDDPAYGFGLTESHDVGIYDSAQNLLVSGTVNPGDLLTGFFRYTSVTSTPLPIGTDYRIAAVTLDDYYTWDPGSSTFSPEIDFVQSRFTSSLTLVYPTDSDDVTGYFGPNFQYEPFTAVPEPGTLVLLAISMFSVFGIRLKWKL